MRTAMSGAILALTVFGSVHSARADTYQFKITGDDNYTFDLPSNPVPLGTNTSPLIIDFYLAAPPGVPTSFVTFYDSSSSGGLSAGTGHDDTSGTVLFDLTDDQLYTGTVNSPQFKLGTFALTGLFGSVSDGHSDTLVITNISTVPLPAALPLFATGLGALGLLGWRRKKKARSA